MTIRLLIAALALGLGAALPGAPAEKARVAVAANFRPTLALLAERFAASGPGGRVELASGSTGKLYAQIKAGAPFDAFFAADAQTPERLEREGRARAGSRFAYARGRLALWTARADLDMSDGAALLRDDPSLRVALANPKLAPYGRAAEQFLQSEGLLDDLRPRLVFGENVAQAFHFARAGAADAAFIALAQAQAIDRSGARRWLPPEDSYEPIEQQAALLSDSETAAAFLAFCRSETARAIIEDAGFLLP